MPDLFLVDDLDGAVMPRMTICHSVSCTMREKCRRSFKNWPHLLEDPQQSFINPDPATCSAYYPKAKEKPVALKQEPLPDRKIGGKDWHMFLEHLGGHFIAHAYSDKTKATFSYACKEGRGEAIYGCIAQVERLCSKPLAATGH